MQFPSLKFCKNSVNHPTPVPIFNNFQPFVRVDAFQPRYHRKNLVSCKRNRLQAINSLNQEKEAQISQEKDDVGNGGGGGGGSSTSFLSLLCPLLKLFSAGDPSKDRNYLLEEATSSLSTLSRFPWGSRSLSDVLNDQQKVNLPQHLQLFEFEACPFCRRVREAITELDLSVEIFPCPKGSIRHREMVRRLGGAEQFPFLVDPNTGISMYESSDIVKYLFRQYGGERSPSFGILESTLVTGWMPTLLRAGKGMTLWKNSAKEPPPEKLELFSFENNPVLRSKYGNGGNNLFTEGGEDPASLQSSWWKDLKNNTFFDPSYWFRGGLRKKIGNGLLTKFWRDIWIDDITLAERFPRLSLVARDREILVGNMGFWEEGIWVWRWNWRRDLFDWEQDTFNDLVFCLNRVTLSQNQEDFWIWNEDRSSRYSVHSAYNIFREEEMIEGDTKEAFSLIWETYCPSKVAAFSWRAIRDRIPTKQNLVRRQIISADSVDFWFPSVLSGNIVGHLLQHKGLWTHATGTKGWMTIWETIIWSIWLLRNNLCFKGAEIHIDDVVESIIFKSWSWIKHRQRKGTSFSYSCDDWKKEPSLCLRAS